MQYSPRTYVGDMTMTECRSKAIAHSKSFVYGNGVMCYLYPKQLTDEELWKGAPYEDTERHWESCRITRAGDSDPQTSLRLRRHKSAKPQCTCDAAGAAKSEACRTFGNDDGCGGNLGEGMGDCDHDSDCAGNLICGAECPWGDGDQCCEQPTAIAMVHTSANHNLGVYTFAAVGLGFLVYGAGKHFLSKEGQNYNSLA